MSVEPLISALVGAVAAGKLTASAEANIRRWLTEPQYAAERPALVEHIASGQWQTLDDVFWTVIPFGTGGRRGGMYPIGTNAINDRTVGESAQGLADYVKQPIAATADASTPLGCAIAYDTRHRSRHFAELCAEIMAAAGFTVWFLDGYRSTPELSFTVRAKRCACGIMVTASHNPPSDNAVKVYWSSGGQLLPPHDRGVIDRVAAVTTIARIRFAQAVTGGNAIFCQAEIDGAYHAAVLEQSVAGPRGLKIVYSPMHGVGAQSIVPVLVAAGFDDVTVFAPHAAPDGDFPNVPGHVANPENSATFDAIIEHAHAVGADIALSTDPDADRLGCAAPIVRGGAWSTLTGNQIGALLAEFVLDGRRRAGRLGREHYVLKTLVTTELVRRIAESYGVTTHGNLHVGFKHIGAAIDEFGPERFVMAAEESHGYLVGSYARDKDATVAALLLAELAASVKAAGLTLHEKLDALYWQHGCHVEMQMSRVLPGSEGMQQMAQLMTGLRRAPPTTLGGMQVKGVRDYLPLTPSADLVVLDLEGEDNRVAIRPSGTEPKVKFYLFAYEAPELIADLAATKDELRARLERVSADLAKLA